MEKREESNIKNVNVYKRVKRITIAGVSMITATVIAAGVLIACQFKTKKDLKTNMQSIVSYYGEDSDESKIINYLDLAIELNNLQLERYKYGDRLEEKLNISNELLDPKEIYSIIKKYKKLIQLNKTDLGEKYDYLKTTVFLNQQRKLIKKYVNDKGYNIVHGAINNSLKEYAAEEYNLNTNNNIHFGYIFEKADSEEVATLNYKEPYNSYMCLIDNDKLVDGVSKMTGLERTNFKDISDEDKLKKYVSVLLKAKNLKTEVDEENVYNEKSEKTLKR